MAAKRYSQFAQNKVGPDGARPSPGLGQKKRDSFDKESTAAWPTHNGTNSGFNKVGFAKVKHSAKTTL